jgi:gliding motility-associated-like protein
MHTIFKNMKIVLALCLTFLLSYSEAQITSTFVSNAEGWTTPNDADGTIGYSGTGGNPGGFVFGSPFVFILGAGSIYVPFDFVAPATYLGNRSAYYNGTLRYDIQLSTAGTPNLYPEVTIANSTDTLYYFPPISNQPAAAPAWTTFSVTLNNALGYWKTTNSATGTAATEARVQSVLTALVFLKIRGLYRNANNTSRLDNVTFMPPLVINTQPVSRIVCDGATTSLTTAATGNASITYQWQKQNIPATAGWADVTNVGGYSGATTATLSVNTTGNFGAGTYRCKVSGTAVSDVFTTLVTITVNANPSAPTTTGNASCGASAITISAAGGAAGQYRWYSVATGGTAIAAQTNSTYTTPVIATTTTYYVSINNGTCESTRTAVIATINTPPGAPTTTGNSSCGTAAITLSAAGGAAGQYQWYTVATGGTAITGQINSTYTTPAIVTTTTYYVSINNGICEGVRTAVTATVNTLPSAPTTTGNSTCVTSSLTLSAAGGAAGQYRWYTLATGGTAITGQTNSAYTTPVLSTTTTYYVSINNGTCESTRTAVIATVLTIPTAPTGTPNFNCGPGSLTLTATGGASGQYRWYDVATGGTALKETSAAFVTPSLTTTTTYYVSISNGTCESSRASVTATILGVPSKPSITSNEPITSGVVQLCLNSITLSAPLGFTYTWSNGETSQQITNVQPGNYSVIVKDAIGCSSIASDLVQVVANTSCINNPPSINTTPLTTSIGGFVSIDLTTLISDPDNNLDPSSLQVVGNATERGGKTTLSGFILDLDYSSIAFSGSDFVTLRICDQLGVCIEKEFAIEVVGEIVIYNGISPNGDGKNDTWIIEYIDLLPDTQKNQVTIYNRWGDVVWEASNYNNTSKVFTGINKNGGELPSGTYFFKIEFDEVNDVKKKTITDYLSLKR